MKKSDFNRHSNEELWEIIIDNAGCLHANIADADMLKFYAKLVRVAADVLCDRANGTRRQFTE